MNDDSCNLTLVIPAYNEELRLARTLSQLHRWVGNQSFEVEVIVVDDGSSDSTAAIAASHPIGCVLISLPSNSGKGAAVRAGMLAAAGDVVAFTDADLPYDLNALLKAKTAIETGEVDIVYGNRLLLESHRVASRTIARSMSSVCFRAIAHAVLPSSVLDTQCGLKVYSAFAAHEVYGRAITNGFSFDVEASYIADQLGLRTAFVEVTLVNEAGSTISLSRHAPAMVRDLFIARLHHAGLIDRTSETIPEAKVTAGRHLEAVRRAA